jgi:hypothetical protein
MALSEANLTTSLTGPLGTTVAESIKNDLNDGGKHDLVPLRAYSAQNLQKMVFLKQIESSLKLYESLDQDFNSSTQNLLASYHSKKKKNARNAVIVGALSCLIYLKLRKAPILVADSYLKNIYSLPFIFGITFTFWKYKFTFVENTKYQFLGQQNAILKSKAQHHSVAVKATNDLKFKFNDTL